MSLLATRSSDRADALGERRLIERIRRWLGPAAPPPPAGIGDDCAVLGTQGGKLLLTVDPVVAGRHFDDAVPPARVARKLLRRNLSDIAAMGGTPLAAVVSLALPGATSVRWLARFHRALGGDAMRHGVRIVGGDITETTGVLVASLTLVGRAGPRVLTRRGARGGDWLYVTGALGGSRLGRHTSFVPRLSEGRWLAGRPEVRCLIDLSDGLAKDLSAITPPGCEPSVAVADLPASAAARRLARRTGRPPWEHAATDGEDFELLFAVARRTNRAAFERAWRRRFDTPLHRLGRLVPWGRRDAGTIDWSALRGYEHLSGRP